MAQEPQASGVSKVLVDLAKSVGRIEGHTEQMSARLDRVHDSVDQLANAGATQHLETTERLTGIESRLEAGDERFGRIEKRLDRLEDRKGPTPSGPSKLEPLIKFAREYGAWLVTGGALLYGLVSAWLKGDAPKP